MAWSDPHRAAAYRKEWYARNKERHKKVAAANRKRYRAEVKGWLLELKSQPCADCGGRFNPWQMDFDHLRDKKVDISKIARNCTRAALAKELAKCELVCANCHRNRTYFRVMKRVAVEMASGGSAKKSESSAQISLLELLGI